MAPGRQGAAAREAVDALLGATHHDDLRLVGEAITAPGMMDAVAERAVPGLPRLAAHDDAPVATRAAVAWRQITR